ncbi:hypothetical protein ACFQ58_10800 [Agromyces sp. NPDC056523]|uniref:hypothetical protein n=1 Tax=Agromyces sp. NPDC056523 TaxID=3345850 RepID=UPI00366C95E2
MTSVGLAAILVCCVPAAPALQGEAQDGADHILYAGELTTQESDPDGLAVETYSVGSFGVACMGSDCTLVGVFPHYFRGGGDQRGIPIVLQDGYAEVRQEATPDYPCTSDRSQAPGTLIVDATASDIVVRWSMAAYACEDPPPLTHVPLFPAPGPSPILPVVPGLLPSPPSSNGSRVGTGALRTVADVEQFTVPQLDEEWVGTYVEGNPCLVDAAACADPPTEAAPGPTESQPGEPESEADDASTASPEATTPSAGADDTAAPTESSGVPPIDPTGEPVPPSAWSSPSRLGHLALITEAGIAPLQLSIAAALTLILVLLVAFPTALLNSAIDELANRRKRAGPPPTTPAHLSGWWKAGVTVLAAGVISSFVHPDFGLNAQSLRITASLLIAFAVDVVIGWSILVWMVRRTTPGVSAWFTFKPWTLLIVAGAVVLTRLTEFEPAIIFGLVAGVTFSTSIEFRKKAPASLISLGYAFAIGLLAWVTYSVIALVVEGEGISGTVFLKEVLSSFAIAGVAALPIVLVPLRGLPGYEIYRWRRVIWGIAYFIALFTFFVIMMPMPFSWLGITKPLAAWVGLYVAYSATALAIWMAVHFTRSEHSGRRSRPQMQT